MIAQLKTIGAGLNWYVTPNIATQDAVFMLSDLGKEAKTYGRSSQKKGRIGRQAHRPFQEKSSGFRNPSGGA